MLPLVPSVSSSPAPAPAVEPPAEVLAPTRTLEAIAGAELPKGFALSEQLVEINQAQGSDHLYPTIHVDLTQAANDSQMSALPLPAQAHRPPRSLLLVPPLQEESAAPPAPSTVPSQTRIDPSGRGLTTPQALDLVHNFAMRNPGALTLEKRRALEAFRETYIRYERIGVASPRMRADLHREVRAWMRNNIEPDLAPVIGIAAFVPTVRGSRLSAGPAGQAPVRPDFQAFVEGYGGHRPNYRALVTDLSEGPTPTADLRTEQPSPRSRVARQITALTRAAVEQTIATRIGPTLVLAATGGADWGRGPSMPDFSIRQGEKRRPLEPLVA